MNRKHTRDFYFNLIDQFRAKRPDIAFSSDFIVGYPGETDKDFQDTIDLIKNVNFAQAYSFKYSPRPGTPASVLQNQVPDEIKDSRLQELQKLLVEQQTGFNNSMIGKKLSILLEKPGKYTGQIIGKSQYMQSVIINNINYQIGDIVDVIIISATQNSLKGEVIS
jgi:tRNA-2-methylthio-N6-dimethylallyladenosine synthase